VDYTDDDLPDFIAWYNDQGWDNGERPLRAEGRLSERSHASSPAEAVAMMEQQRNEGPRLIPVFGDDGKTVIGTGFVATSSARIFQAHAAVIGLDPHMLMPEIDWVRLQ
jgi:hypothetical protein